MWAAVERAVVERAAVGRAAVERAAVAVTTGRAEAAGLAAVAAEELLVRGAAGVLAARLGVATRFALRFGAGLTERRAGWVAPLVVADTDGAEAFGAAVAGACAVALAAGAVAGAAAAGALGAGLLVGADVGPPVAGAAGGVVDGVGGVAGVPKPGGVQAQARLAPATATLSIDRRAK